MQMARNLAVEWGPRNVRVNCIAPGLVRTDFARALWENPAIYDRPPSATTRCAASASPTSSPAPRCSSPLRPGSFTTGQTIVVDGGATIAGG